MSGSVASTELKNQGLVVKLGKPAQHALPKGDVIKTLPAAAAGWPAGASVTLIVSLGPVMSDGSESERPAARGGREGLPLEGDHLKAGQRTSRRPPARCRPGRDRHDPGRGLLGGPAEPAGQAGRQRGTSAAQLRRHAADGRPGGGRSRAATRSMPCANAKGSEPANTITSQSPAAEHPDHARRGGDGPLSRHGPPTVPRPERAGHDRGRRPSRSCRRPDSGARSIIPAPARTVEQLRRRPATSRRAP